MSCVVVSVWGRNPDDCLRQIYEDPGDIQEILATPLPVCISFDTDPPAERFQRCVQLRGGTARVADECPEGATEV